MGKMTKKRLIAPAIVAVAAIAAAVIWALFLSGGSAGGLKETKKVKISIVTSGIGTTFPPGFNENDNPYLDYIEKNTNLDINVILPPVESYEEKLSIIMSSGNLPDMLHAVDEVWVANYARQGKLEALEDLIDQYGPELRKKIPKEAWDKVTYNGRIYAVPSMNEVKGIELMYARKDWLDRLGLKPPQTLDEYYEVIRAFALNDPDGDGKDNTIGLLLTENLGRSAPFFGAFGTQLDQWLERDGKLVYSNTLPETKEALGFLRKLYAEGLIDPEFPLNRSRNLEEKIVSGRVGLFSATWYDTRGPIELNKQRDPKAEWIPLEFPTGPNGRKGVYATSPIRAMEVVPAGSPNAASVIRMLNFIAGEGHSNLKLGFENEIWTMNNGKMVTDFAEHLKHQYRGIYSALVDVVEPELDKQRLDSLGEHFHLYDNLQRIEKNLIPDRFTGLPTPAMGKYMMKLSGLKDVLMKIVVGVYPLDEFDHYVERWRHEGGDEITREVNDWYHASAP
ncbi:extracellular solute-binding protein [Paenibacillus hodogayensis]|uniref:Extracellular solute-binding protein n=1 Tax=Paenibacillus hodogayensis TaxID=279208 RepID=A0ABV5W7Q0_9BACL